jgi:hypothetical protein
MQVQILVGLPQEINALPKGAGEKASLKPKENFERSPHLQGGAHDASS